MQPIECCVPVLMQLYYNITVVVDMERISVQNSKKKKKRTECEERSGLVSPGVVVLVRAVNHLYTAFPVFKLTSINIGSCLTVFTLGLPNPVELGTAASSDSPCDGLVQTKSRATGSTAN